MRRSSFLILCLAASTAAQADCGAEKRALVVEYISTPPLLATEPDPSTIVQVDASGCVIVHVPSYRVDAGDYRLQLKGLEFGQLQSELEAANLRAIDARALGRRLQTKSLQRRTDAPLVAIRDENLIQFRVPATKRDRAAALRFSGLRQALAEHARDDELQRLSRLHARLEAIAEQAQRGGKKVNP